MNKNITDISGNQYGRLKVIKYAYTQNQRSYWQCKCRCGQMVIACGKHMRDGRKLSCGCLRKENAAKTGKKQIRYDTDEKRRIHRIYQCMLNRCYRTKDIAYKRYGGRGIKVCSEWKGEFGYTNFYDWAINSGYANNLTLDRISNNGDYSPSNCRWSTYKEQENNKSDNRLVDYFGKLYTVSQLSDAINIPYNTLLWRVENGWSCKELSLPVNLSNKHIRRQIGE